MVRNDDVTKFDGKKEEEEESNMSSINSPLIKSKDIKWFRNF